MPQNRFGEQTHTHTQTNKWQTDKTLSQIPCPVFSAISLLYSRMSFSVMLQNRFGEQTQTNKQTNRHVQKTHLIYLVQSFLQSLSCTLGCPSPSCYRTGLGNRYRQTNKQTDKKTHLIYLVQSFLQSLSCTLGCPFPSCCRTGWGSRQCRPVHRPGGPAELCPLTPPRIDLALWASSPSSGQNIILW